MSTEQKDEHRSNTILDRLRSMSKRFGPVMITKGNVFRCPGPTRSESDTTAPATHMNHVGSPQGSLRCAVGSVTLESVEVPVSGALCQSSIPVEKLQADTRDFDDVPR